MWAHACIHIHTCVHVAVLWAPAMSISAPRRHCPSHSCYLLPLRTARTDKRTSVHLPQTVSCPFELPGSSLDKNNLALSHTHARTHTQLFFLPAFKRQRLRFFCPLRGLVPALRCANQPRRRLVLSPFRLHNPPNQGSEFIFTIKVFAASDCD